MGAAAPQVKPGNQRDIEIPRNVIIAMRAMGRGEDDIFSARQPVDTDVKEAAHDAAEDEKGNCPEMERDDAPVIGLRHGAERGWRVNKHVP